jgi:hypothetical protein
MRKFFVTTSVLAAMLCLASSGFALEKRAAVLNADRSDDWNAGATCRVSYYNICTGWVWVWSGFGDNAKIGQVMNSCCGQGESAGLLQAQIFCPTGAPSSYGFTGTLTAHAVDGNNCPTGPALASAPFLPTSAFTIVNFAGESVPSTFVLVANLEEDLGIPSPASFGTEHPAAGPTGPQACGTCYPTNRVNRSFAYGTTASPVCPGSAFNDGVCDSQLFWDVFLSCTVSVEESSWGSIKNLYR